MRIHPDPYRRWFLKALASASVLPLAGHAARALAQVPAKPEAATVPAAAPGSTAPAVPAAPGPSPDVAPLTQILKNRYGTQISDEQLAALAPDLDRMVQIGQRLRKVKLQNADEPDFVFRAAPGR